MIISAQLVSQLIGYAIQYGLPAVLDLIAVIKKPAVTLEELQAAFAKARTPFDQGLNPGVLKPTPPPTG